MSTIPERLIAARHNEEKGEWACFRELATGTGHSGHAGRTADLFALNCYPSKGFRAIVYEVKVSRSDFKREIEDMTKRRPWEKIAHECYFATTPGLVKPDEVPEGWGLVEVGAEVRVIKVATQRTPEPWPMTFMAAIARRSADAAQPRASKAVWRLLGQDITGEQLEKVVRGRAKELSHGYAPLAPRVMEPVISSEDAALLRLVRNKFAGKTHGEIATALDAKAYDGTRLEHAIRLLEQVRSST